MNTPGEDGSSQPAESSLISGGSAHREVRAVSTPKRLTPHRGIDDVKLVNGKLVRCPPPDEDPSNAHVQPATQPDAGAFNTVATNDSRYDIIVKLPKISAEESLEQPSTQVDGDLVQTLEPIPDLPSGDPSYNVGAASVDSSRSSETVHIKTEDQDLPAGFAAGKPTYYSISASNTAPVQKASAETSPLYKTPSVQRWTSQTAYEPPSGSPQTSHSPSQPRKRGNWPTAAELRPYKNKSPRAEIEEDLDVRSDCADAGWGDSPVARQETELELGDWSGGWAPAPGDWIQRPQFPRTRYQERILEWIQDADATTQAIEIGSGQDQKKGDIAPRSWIPEQIESMEPAAYWSHLVRLLEVGEDAIPWWDSYKSEDSLELKIPECPSAFVDKEYNDAAKLQQSSTESMLTFQNHMLTVQEAEKEKKQRDRAERQAARHYVVPQNEYSPKAYVYFRPANDEDMEQITDIFNRYVQNTVSVPEMDPLMVSDMKLRFDGIIKERLPFIVAIEYTPVFGYSKNKNSKSYEKIVGFGFAVDFDSMDSMYRFAVEIQVYVNPEHTRKGIGRCMVDKLLSILDMAYLPRGGYEFLAGDSMGYGGGGRRRIGSIMSRVPYWTQDVSRRDWIQRWLSQFQFSQVAEFQEVGDKLSKTVNLAMFLRPTHDKGQNKAY